MGRKSFGSFLDASFMSIDATFTEHVSDSLYVTPNDSVRKKRKRRVSRGSTRDIRKTPKVQKSKLRDISNTLTSHNKRKRKLSPAVLQFNKKQKKETDWRLIAEEAYSKGNYSEAKRNYLKCSEYNHDEKDNIISNIALCDLFLGNYVSALEGLRLKKTKTLQSAFLEAKILIFQGDIMNALPNIEFIIKYKHNNTIKQELLKHLDFKKEAAILTKSCSKYKALLSSLNQNLINEKPVEAFQDAKLCEEISPKCLRIWLAKVISNFLSIALFKSSSKKSSSSLDNKEISLTQEQLHQITIKNKGLQKELHDILKESMKSENISKKITNCILQYANMFIKQAFLNEAILLLKVLYKSTYDNFAKILLDKVNSMESCLSVGLKKMKSKDYESAIKYFTDCLNYDDDNYKFNGRLLFRRATAYLELELIEKGIKDLKLCLEYLPNYERAVLKLVDVLSKKSNYTEALKYLEGLYKEKRTKELSFEVRKLRILKEKQDFLKNKKYETPPRRHRYNTRFSAKIQRKKKTFYDILGVKQKASKATIRKAYKKLALKLHPDKQTKKDNSVNEKFQELNSAYTVLNSPAQRKQYDKTIG